MGFAWELKDASDFELDGVETFDLVELDGVETFDLVELVAEEKVLLEVSAAD